MDCLLDDNILKNTGGDILFKIPVRGWCENIRVWIWYIGKGEGSAGGLVPNSLSQERQASYPRHSHTDIYNILPLLYCTYIHFVQYSYMYRAIKVAANALKLFIENMYTKL